MIIPRSLYSSAPRARTKTEDNPTLLVSWWCTGFALAIIVVRLAGRYVRAEKLFREDKIIAWSIIPLLGRMALVHLVLIWGTNNAITTGLTDVQLRHREIGSKLVLVSRIMYAAFLWTAKLSISEFLKRLTSQVWKRSYEIGLQIVRWVLALTFLAIVIATLAECQPFSHYWQLVPDPGPRCRQGYAQLITMGSSDVLTDFLLVGFPTPIIIKSTIATKQKFSLVSLFGLSLVLVGITLYRVVAVIDRHSEQQFRSLLASLEILAAAAVANALVLGSFIRDRGAKKQHYRFGSVAGSSSLDRGTGNRRETITARHWGSDADLVGDVGIRLQGELSADERISPRPAPMAIPLASQAQDLTPSVGNKDWTSQEQSSIDTDAIGVIHRHKSTEQAFPTSARKTTSRSRSFFDVGGLLEDQSTLSPPCYPTTTWQSQGSSTRLSESDEFSVHHNNRHGKNALLQDIGGLLTSGSGPPPASTRRRRKSSVTEPSRDVLSASKLKRDKSVLRSKGTEENSPPPSLQDAGGLLT